MELTYCAAAADIFKNLTENLGFRVLKFEISAQYGLTGYHPDLAIDGPLFAPHLARAAELGLTVTVDTGVMGTESFQIEGLCHIRDRHPGLTLVVAHTLFPSPVDGRNEERLALLHRLVGENVYFDVANLALHQAPQRDYVRAAMDIVGADHMMWGTDCPGVFRKRSYRELVADISNNGIVMTGGGSLVEGFDKLITARTGIHTVVAENAISCVAEGTGKSLDSLNAMQDGTVNLSRRRQMN